MPVYTNGVTADRRSCNYAGMLLCSTSYKMLLHILLSLLSAHVDGIVGGHK